jgi:formylglycine-generating enzyme required for sulfatase activity
MRFAWIPPGTFVMGSPLDENGRDDDETQHSVTLTRGFYLGIHPVTQAQWQAVMGNNPSRFKGENLPVETVSGQDCREFCQKLGQMDGKRYRLPTEAEWEYACRAGTTTPFHFGETIDTEQANYNGDYTYGKGKKGISRQQTTPVGSFPPNAWGLFDMHGNVYEWCADGYEAYPPGDLRDFQVDNKGSPRLLRGGSWFLYPHRCRSAFRRSCAPAYRQYDVGCRVILCLD